MPTTDAHSAVACRIVARGRIVRDWSDGSSRDPYRTRVVLVHGRDGQHLVVDSGMRWTAHPATDADIETVSYLKRTEHLFNVCAVLPDPLESLP